MLWLCLHFPRLPLELHPPRDGCCAVFDQQGSRRWLLACNEPALQAGLRNGLDVTAALARVPRLALMPRVKHQERAACKALGAWAGQYSSQVCIDTDRWLVWIEIGGSLNYFGGQHRLIKHLNDSVTSLGYTAEIGIASTLEAAVLLVGRTTQCIEQGSAALKLALASLPITLLPVEARIIEALQGIGWRYIGEVLALPHDQLARRFGPAFTEYLQRLLGQRPDVRVMYRAPTIYQRRVDLAASTDNIEALLFPLQRMLGELQGYLRSRDTALQTLQLSLHHHKNHATQLVLNTTTPQRDAVRLLKLLHEHLQRAPLSMAVVALTIKVEQFVSFNNTQLDLFNAQSHAEQRWQELLDKLQARLGDQAVKRLAPLNDHRPERAWCVLQTGDKSPMRYLEADEQLHSPDRPLWLLPPTPLESPPPLLGKPERIEAGWWNGDDIRRDYYIAETSEGSRWWVYRDAISAQWFLQGLWA